MTVRMSYQIGKFIETSTVTVNRDWEVYIRES